MRGEGPDLDADDVEPGTYRLTGTGERFDNADGGSRQDELRLCRTGERVDLRREPANPRDPMAVALFSVRGVQIGYLAREHAQWVGGAIDGGRDVLAAIERVASRTRPGSPLAVTVRIEIGGQAAG